MNDSFTEVTHIGWFGRIRESITGVLIGLLMVAVSIPLLWFNEGCTVKRHKALKEGRGAVVVLAGAKVDPANEGALVHVTGKATTEETITLPVFNVSSQALKLEATVEMYQWRESKSTQTEKKVGGGETRTTTYSYSKSWSSRVIDSSRFNKAAEHQNPQSMPVQPETVITRKGTVGEFALTRSLIEKIKNRRRLDSGGEVPPELADKAKAHQQGFYIGEDPDSPAIGDVRIQFFETPSTEVSIVAQQIKNTFQPYQAKTGTIQLLQDGIHSADAMFTKAANDQILLTWGLRVGGFILMLIGFVMILKPLSILADVIPLIGNIVEAGTFMVSAIISSALTLIIVAMAWVYYRPLVGIGIFLVAALIGGSLFFFRKKVAAAGAGGSDARSSTPAPVQGQGPSAATPPPPAPPTGKEFYLYINEETVGPYAEADLREYVNSGQVAPETFCVPVGEEEWKPVAECL